MKNFPINLKKMLKLKELVRPSVSSFKLASEKEVREGHHNYFGEIGRQCPSSRAILISLPICREETTIITSLATSFVAADQLGRRWTRLALFIFLHLFDHLSGKEEKTESFGEIRFDSDTHRSFRRVQCFTVHALWRALWFTACLRAEFDGGNLPVVPQKHASTFHLI